MENNDQITALAREYAEEINPVNQLNDYPEAKMIADMMRNAKWGDKYSHIATISCAAADALIIEVEKKTNNPLKNK